MGGKIFEFLPLARRGVVTNPIIGNKWTPYPQRSWTAPATLVRKSAGLFLHGGRAGQITGRSGLFGSPEGAWDTASETLRQTHIIYKKKPFKTVLSKIPLMYDDC